MRQEKKIRLSKKTQHLIREEAFCFYKPLPLKKLGLADLVKYIAGTLSGVDIVLIVLSGLAISLLGLFSPYVTKLIFERVVPSGELGLLLPITFLLLGLMISTALIGITRTLLMARIRTKMNISIEAAAINRMLSLPAVFFKDYNAGELSSRLSSMKQLGEMLTEAFLSTGLTALFSFVYLFQIMSFTPGLVLPSLLIILTQLVFTVLTGLIQLAINRRKINAAAKLNGFTFAVFSGIQKNQACRCGTAGVC